MLLRLRGPDGMARLTIEPTATFGEMGKQVSLLSMLELHREADSTT